MGSQGREIAMLGSGTWQLRMVMVLASVVLCRSEEDASLDSYAPGHPADEPAWFDISALNDEDISNLVSEAHHYMKESNKIDALERAESDVQQKRIETEAKRKQKLASRPTVDIPKEASEVAQMQQKLAMKLLSLDQCQKKLKKCKKADKTELGESQDDLAKVESDPIEIPHTTARQDWDERYHGKKPDTWFHNWQKGQPINIPKTTAEQDYVEKQKDESFAADDEHEPGYKLPHDRLFASDVTAVARMANETKKLVDASLAEDSKLRVDAATSASKHYVSLVEQLLAAQTKLKEKRRAPLRKESVAALATTEKLSKECEAKVKKAKC